MTPTPNPLAAVAERLHPDLDEYKPRFRQSDDEMAELRRENATLCTVIIVFAPAVIVALYILAWELWLK